MHAWGDVMDYLSIDAFGDMFNVLKMFILNVHYLLNMLMTYG